MTLLTLISDTDLLALMPSLVLVERARVADVIEHLVEIDRRRLFIGQACPSLSSYCIERLGYSEDEAGKRVRVARLASRLPQVLDELRAGGIHLTGLFLLAQYLSEENHELLLSLARGKSRRQIEQLIAERFPKPDLPDRICPLPEQLSWSAAGGGQDAAAPATPATCPGTGVAPALGPGTAPATAQAAGRLEPLSGSRWSVQFTASAELHDKIERARELLSHALPGGELGALFERAIDELIERETKRRLGADKPRKRRPLSAGSRHVPVAVARLVWQRDGGQCTFVDEHGRRCSARRFLTLEHRHPYALGGPPTAENLSLLCGAHNAQAARDVFGQEHIEAKRVERQERDLRQRECCAPNPDDVGSAEREQAAAELARVHDKLLGALLRLGYKSKEAKRVLGEILLHPGVACPAAPIEQLLREALWRLTPAPGAKRAGAPSMPLSTLGTAAQG